ncbi:hypothetical protein ACLOJK_014822 [Asimina triloba]
MGMSHVRWTTGALRYGAPSPSRGVDHGYRPAGVDPTRAKARRHQAQAVFTIADHPQAAIHRPSNGGQFAIHLHQIRRRQPICSNLISVPSSSDRPAATLDDNPASSSPSAEHAQIQVDQAASSQASIIRHSFPHGGDLNNQQRALPSAIASAAARPSDLASSRSGTQPLQQLNGGSKPREVQQEGKAKLVEQSSNRGRPLCSKSGHLGSNGRLDVNRVTKHQSKNRKLASPKSDWHSEPQSITQFGGPPISGRSTHTSRGQQGGFGSSLYSVFQWTMTPTRPAEAISTIHGSPNFQQLNPNPI